MIRKEAFSFLGAACPHVEWYRETDSTNLRARAYAAAHPGEDAIFFADAQTAGRGRLGRRFESPQGAGLYMTLLLHPNLAPDRMGSLTTFAALAVSRAIEEVCDVRPGIKWVNDVYLCGKKVAGILAEGVFSPQSGALAYAVLGIGVNLARAPLPPEVARIATSIEEACGVAPCAETMAVHIVRHLLCDGAFDDPRAMAEYRRRSFLIGKDVELCVGDRRRRAHVLDILDTGALYVRLSDGSCESIVCGEVSVRPMNGAIGFD